MTGEDGREDKKMPQMGKAATVSLAYVSYCFSIHSRVFKMRSNVGEECGREDKA